MLVSGASTGIGRKVSERLAADGYFVYAGARKDADLEALGKLESVQALRLDVTRQEDIEAAVSTIEQAGRGLYGLINNAGVGTQGSLVESREDEFELTMRVNAFGPWRVTKAFAALIIAAKGRIATTGSVSGILAGANLTSYAMSKHAVEAFTDALAAEPEQRQTAGAATASGSLVHMTPETRYARLGDLHLAYQVLGAGPPDMLLLDQWFSHMEAQWDVGPLATFRERLASFARLIMFDKRGTGQSDPVPTSALPTVEAWMDDVPAVLDAVGSERAHVIANLGGGIMALTYAAAHPERVASLILVDCYARFRAAPDFPIGAPPEFVPASLAQAEAEPGRGVMIDLFAPSLVDDERLRRAWSRYERQAASPGSFVATVRFLYESDVRDVLPSVRVPTLVIHRADARGFRPEHGRYLAERIPGAKYVELPGIDNMIWAGDQDAMVAEIQDFVTGIRPAPTPNRILATVLFTDIVGSTRLAAELGDERWQALLRDHHRVARQQLERFGGHEVKTVGDGLLTTFDGPARAIRCAGAIRDAVREFGLEIRAGIHTGEIEVQPADIAGLAVHIGARISAMAGDGEILVSRTVKDLVVGSGIAFEDRGTHELRGVPGEWQLFTAAL